MGDTLVTVTDGGVLFAKNGDRDPNEAQILRWLLSQPWWLWGAEMGANAHGLVIGNEAVFTRRTGDKPGPDALLGMDLVRHALERATDRRSGVEVIVGLLERHGQGGSASHEHPGFSYDNSFAERYADPVRGGWSSAPYAGSTPPVARSPRAPRAT